MFSYTLVQNNFQPSPNKTSLSQVGDLQHASPATVSHCGTVFIDPKNLRYTPYWQRWVKNRPEQVTEMASFSHFQHLQNETPINLCVRVCL